ncbi:MAG: helix-turn-helix transcriptional regulator [Rugosibacter sp.]|nr:helix-turn-helix transcriptional regulator [Rugosibacter sp.]
MNSLLPQQFGACVRALRQETGMSQVEFGEKCGFYQTYLSRIENGQANPTLNAIEVIANTLGLSVFQLFDKVKEMPRRGKKPDSTIKQVTKSLKKRKAT